MFFIDNTYSLPVWPWIDITSVFEALWRLLIGLWNWSGSCGIVFHGDYIYWRDILIAGLVVSLMLHRIFGSHDAEEYDTINETSYEMTGRYYYE